MARGDLSGSAIIFIILVLAGLIISIWYIASIRPTRLIVGTVMEDLAELRRHVMNACAVTRYDATYLTQTTAGNLTVNRTHVCLTTEVFGSCERLGCNAKPASILYGPEPAVLNISKNAGTITIGLG